MAAKGAVPVQLVRLEGAGARLRLELCEEGAAELVRHGARPIALVGVCGPARTGKSYLLNLLCGRVRSGLPVVGVGATTEACTRGLWLWSRPDASDSGGPVIAFLDCEGFGSPDRDRTQDAKLLTLCTLLSSVLVLNTRGALDTQQLGSLALASRLAQHVEESGCKASWPSLLWVLRDFYLELADRHGTALTADEYLEQALYEGPEEHRGVREDLRRLFTSRSCATLPRPAAEEDQLQALDSLPYEQLRPEFQQGLEELNARLLAACRASPKSAGGQPLGCASLVALARRLVSSLNEGRVVSLRGAWESVQHDTCGALADELREQGCARLRKLHDGGQLEDGAALPMSDEALGAALARLRHQLRKQWAERALGEEAVQQEYWQDLEASLDREEVLLRAHNDRVGDLQLTEALKQWQVWVIDPSGTWQAGDPLARRFRAQMERTPHSALARGAGVALEATGRRLVMAREALAADRAAVLAREGEAAGAELRRLTAEVEAQRAENDRLRAEMGEMGTREAAGLSEGQAQLQAEREARRKSKERAVTQLMESQHKSGLLEGQMQVMGQELAALRERSEELQRAAAAAAGQKALHEAERERLQHELEEAAASAKDWRARAEQHSEAAAAAAEGAGAATAEVHGPAAAQPACCILQ